VFRKIAHIVFALLLMTSTMGFTVSKHYCCSELIEISINSEAEPCCDDVGTSGCCHDEMEYFQLKEDFVSPIYFENLEDTGIDLLFPTVVAYLPIIPDNIDIEVFNFAESPPPPTLQGTLSLLQTYLI